MRIENEIEMILKIPIKEIDGNKVSYSKNAFDKYKNVENICLPVIMVDDRKFLEKKNFCL